MNNYSINNKIVKLISSLSINIGEIKANFLLHQNKDNLLENKISIISNTLYLDDNKLSQNQINELITKKKFMDLNKDSTSVLNYSKVYDKHSKINYKLEKRLLDIHKELLNGIAIKTGSYKNQNELISLQKELFEYINKSDDLIFIKSCVVHYQLQTLKPFNEGNGRIARLWQRLILSSEFPIFEFLPFENYIVNSKKDYEAILRKKNLTLFIEYMLDVLNKSLVQLLNYNNRILKDTDRINYFSTICKIEFSRKDYMNIFKDLSTASASRDLKKAVELGIYSVMGDRNKTRYRVTKYNYLKLS